jgi:hypothetical protein
MFWRLMDSSASAPVYGRWQLASALLIALAAGAAISDFAESKRIANGETNTLRYAIQEEIAIGSQVANIVNDAGLHVYGIEVQRLASTGVLFKCF